MKENNIPRRMQRFYREKNKTTAGNETYYPEEEYSKILPSMEYEDLEKHLSDENKKEMKRLEQGDLEQKLALFEVEKFKKTNKRLPNKKESQQIADSVYTQLKESDVISPEKDRGRRGRRNNSTPAFSFSATCIA